MQSEKAAVALQLLDRVSKAGDKYRKLLAKQMYGRKMTSPQFGVLEILNRLGTVPLKKISEEMMVTGANITCVVDNLEKEGFVKRIHSKEDRRVVYAELTNSGKNKLNQIMPEYLESLVDITNKLSEDEQNRLINLLEKFNS
ncbi:MAG: MarR family transcriptional regulator [Ignavibacteriales bacterium]|nr:MarR family transcriptional regulator [Ignavibacteriales bacterium]